MNVPCGAPFPLALRLWLCQLCRVWPPPTGNTKEDSKWTGSFVSGRVYPQNPPKYELSVIVCHSSVCRKKKKKRRLKMCWDYIFFAGVSTWQWSVEIVHSVVMLSVRRWWFVKPRGNGDGGIPVTMVMSKLICDQISTWERLIQGNVLIYSSWWILMHSHIHSDVWALIAGHFDF